ncbi:class I SAM-dependent methyltransferase [Corallococcus terminator]|uniref:Class I SAM-dependent methyltransferase n=1 Tax=Corallococcus terminator TaxID=2316733 RepID=A0A3A8I822_9BACT|nr:class I SAM-dependent methyltransferase [Corallococcus terminator]RKG73813.1 class I SAM-dependent methyltransferase [Corallococcus terminator]
MPETQKAATLIVVAHPEDVVRLFSTVAEGADLAVVTEDGGAGRELEAVGRALGARTTHLLLSPSEIGPWCREQREQGDARVFTHSPQEEAPLHREVAVLVSRVFERLWVPSTGARPTVCTVLDDAAFQRKLSLLNTLYRERPDGAQGSACTDPLRDGPGIEAFTEVRSTDMVRALSLTKPEIFSELADPWGFAGSSYEGKRFALTAKVLESLCHASPPPRRVVDVGACEGMMTEHLLSLFPHASVQAVESEPRFAARLRERLGGHARVRVVEASAEDVALEADLVLLAEVLYYLSDDACADLLDRVHASHLLTSYGGGFGAKVHAALAGRGWKVVTSETLASRIEPVDGVWSPLLVRRAGTEIRLWKR